MSPYADPQAKRDANRRFHSRPSKPREPLSEPVIVGTSVVHRVGRPVGSWWQEGGSHHSFCGILSGDPERDLGVRRLCRTCFPAGPVLVDPPHPDAPDYERGDVGDYHDPGPEDS